MILTKIRSIRGKTVLPIAATLTVVLVLLVVFAQRIITQNSQHLAQQLAMEKSQKSVKMLETDITAAFGAAQNLVDLFSQFETIEPQNRREAFNRIIHDMLERRPEFMAISTFWEPFALDKLDTLYKDQYFEKYGPYLATFYNYKGFVGKELMTDENILKHQNSDQFIVPKTIRQPVILEPQQYSYTGENKDRQWRISVVLPIIKDNNFLGIVGIDLSMSRLSSYLSSNDARSGQLSFVIDSRGRYVIHKDMRRVNTSFVEANRELAFQNNIIEFIKQLKDQQFQDNFENDTYGFTILPMQLDFSDQLWAFVHADNFRTITGQSKTFVRILYLGAILIVILVVLVNMSVGNSILKPLRRVNKALVKLAMGDLTLQKPLENSNNDETLQTTQLINDLYLQLGKVRTFADSISAGNLTAEYQLQSKQDILGKSLLNLQQNLISSAEEEQIRRKIEENQNWVNIGLTKFSDILRRDATDISELAHQIVSNLVRYLDANQGGMFLLVEDRQSEPRLELLTAFAYDTRKFLKKELKLKEGLVGTCALERETIYLTEIPEDYITITSGMGEARPRTLLIVPLKLENQVKGVIEIASFNELAKYQIDFVQQLAESIALTVSTVQINQQTKKLLEQSQKQSDELASQEEEMRQNLEELQATQEESARKEFHMQGLVHALNNSAYTMEYDETGKITDVNDGFLQLLNVAKDELVGKQHRDVITFEGKEDFDYYRFWNDLRNGVSKKEISRIVNDGLEIWLNETYTPLYNTEGEVYKILKIAFDITESKQQSEELAQQKEELAITHSEMESYFDELTKTQQESEVKALELQSIIESIEKKFGLAELLHNGEIIRFNEHIRNFYGVTGDYQGHNIREFLQMGSVNEFDNLWNEVAVGNTVEKEYMSVVDGRERHYLEIYKPVMSEHENKLLKVFIIAQEQTAKIKAIEELELIANKYAEYKDVTEKTIDENQQQLEVLSKENFGYKAVVDLVENQLYLAEYDLETKLLRFNENWMNLFHAEPADVKRKMHNDFIVVDNLLKYHVLWSKIRTGSIQKRETKYEFKQKEVYMYDIYVPVTDENGEIFKIVVVSQDITLFKRKENEHRRVISELRREKNNPK